MLPAIATHGRPCPGIHVFIRCKAKTFMPWANPGMTSLVEARACSAANPYCETVCTTLLIGRLATAGTFWSFTSIASYSGRVSSCSLAFICTTL